MINRHFTTDLPEKFKNSALTSVWKLENERYIKNMSSLMLEYKMPSYYDVVNSTKGSKKKRYIKALNNIIEKRIIFDQRQTRVNFFVKVEKWPVSKIEKGKPPRGIQFRSFEYLLALKRAMTPLVDLTKIDHDFGDYNMSKVFTKNHTPKVIAKNLREAWDSFKCPVAICMDHSLWDGRYAKELLEQEHNRHLKITKLKNNSLLGRLLKAQIKNGGYSMGGIKYKVIGHRCSGEYTTSHGNGESNFLILRTVCIFLGIIRFIIFVNGDDSIILCEEEDRAKLENNLHLFKNFNQLTEIEISTNVFEEITYCQTSPVLINDGDGNMIWNMVRNPTRVISRINYSDQNWGKCLNKFLVSLGLCELSVNMGVPILQELSIWLIRKGGCVRPLTTYKTDHYSNDQLRIVDINLETRVSFEKAFGMSISEQLNIETILRDEYNDQPRDHSDIHKILEFLNYKLY